MNPTLNPMTSQPQRRRAASLSATLDWHLRGLWRTLRDGLRWNRRATLPPHGDRGSPGTAS
jgi:hypothetical protein